MDDQKKESNIEVYQLPDGLSIDKSIFIILTDDGKGKCNIDKCCFAAKQEAFDYLSAFVKGYKNANIIELKLLEKK